MKYFCVYVCGEEGLSNGATKPSPFKNFYFELNLQDQHAYHRYQLVFVVAVFWSNQLPVKLFLSLSLSLKTSEVFPQGIIIVIKIWRKWLVSVWATPQKLVKLFAPFSPQEICDQVCLLPHCEMKAKLQSSKWRQQHCILSRSFIWEHNSNKMCIGSWHWCIFWSVYFFAMLDHSATDI